MANNNAYKASIELAFDYIKTENSSPQRTTILPERIQYLMIDSKFENVNVLPIIYLSLKIPMDLHDKIVNTYKTSRFYLKLTRKDTMTGSSVSSLAINDTFSYITSNTEQNTAKGLNDDGLDDKAYIATTIGLVSTSMTSLLRKSFNGVYNNISIKKLVNMALDGLPNVIMTPLKYSKEVDSFIINPISTRYKLLELIFDELPFYDTNFNFFMDFNKKVYLLDKSGNAVGSDGYPSTIYFNITQVDDPESISPGGTVNNGAYRIYVNASQTKFNVNESVSQIANKIEAYDYSGEYQELTVEKSIVGDSDKTIYLKTDNAAVYRNEIVNNTVLVELYKQNIDPVLITPNRAYVVNQDSNYSKYNGNYILSYKQELYVQDGNGEFNLTCTVGLKRINSIELANSTKDITGGKAIGSSSSANKGGSRSATNARVKSKSSTTTSTSNSARYSS